MLPSGPTSVSRTASMLRREICFPSTATSLSPSLIFRLCSAGPPASICLILKVLFSRYNPTPASPRADESLWCLRDVVLSSSARTTVRTLPDKLPSAGLLNPPPHPAAGAPPAGLAEKRLGCGDKSSPLFWWDGVADEGAVTGAGVTDCLLWPLTASRKGITVGDRCSPAGDVSMESGTASALPVDEGGVRGPFSDSALCAHVLQACQHVIEDGWIDVRMHVCACVYMSGTPGAFRAPAACVWLWRCGWRREF